MYTDQSIKLAPLDTLAEHIWFYFRNRVQRKDMVKILLNKHIDTDLYGLRYVHMSFCIAHDF